MIKYTGTRLMRAGFIGAMLMLLVIAIGLAPARIGNWASAIRYQASFAEGGGLSEGADVKIAGVKVGTVSAVSLSHGDALVDFTVRSGVTLGEQTTAHIRTGTLLGERVLTLESFGSGTMRPRDRIPTSRTSSPYSLTEAVSELTSNTEGTDLSSVNQSLDTLSETIDQIAPQLGPTFDGLTRLSASINGRNEQVSTLLEHAGDVTAILAQRSQQVNMLLLNGNDLLGVLVERRQAIVSLLNDTSALAKQLAGLVADNEAELAPTLEKLNSLTEMLERNRDNINKALPGLAKYQTTLGETVANGPGYVAQVANLDLAEVFQPFFDYAFGFRRGTDAGQPPDNAGPRAELPIPYNNIPPGPHS
ncbi:MULTISPECIES: MCE family protein [unclassified Mycobacterium]|uniref:MCE family protein n=1 Tax=unclassified Mycobacterium TaxID=2642494 RepID=UPI0029C8A2B3|nr:MULTISPECIES: MCE family protein [unclassified Mycobacterium]